MLRFNTLLTEAGFDPATVQLVRHQDLRTRGASPYSMWRNRRDAFEAYQRVQRRDVFDTPGILAAFVVPPNGDTLFAGIYEVRAVAPNAEPETCPLHGTVFAPNTINTYEIEPSSQLDSYAGLVTVDWGEGMRAWVQRAQNQNKPILEIRRHREDPPFPGFSNFHVLSSEIFTLPETWAAVLSSTGGVYLLVSELTGEQYVGSATGEEGFWSRWLAYATDGHGGNVILRQRGNPPYIISILETAPSYASRQDVLLAEQRWKERLGSRAFGLNGN